MAALVPGVVQPGVLCSHDIGSVAVAPVLVCSYPKTDFEHFPIVLFGHAYIFLCGLPPQAFDNPSPLFLDNKIVLLFMIE